jgi:hypothetical protein
MLAACGSTAAAPREAREQDGWAIGEDYSYKLHLVSRAGIGADRAQGSLFEFDLVAKLRVTPLERTDERSVLLLHVEDGQFSRAESDEARARFDDAARDLGRGAVFTYQRGAAAEARLPRDASALAVAILRNIAAAFQFAPPSQGESVWTAEEYDATGKYVAEYRSTSDPERFTKTKLRYTALILDKKLEAQVFPVSAAAPKFAMSTGEIRRHRGISEHMQLSEELDTVLTSATPLRARTSLDLEFASRTASAAVDRAALAASTTLIEASAPYVHASSDLDLDAAKIGGLTFDQIVSGLETIAKESEDVKLTETLNGAETDPEEVAAGKAWMGRRNRFFTALAATFRKHPETIPRALAIIRAGSTASDAMVSALGAAGTEAGHEALLSLMADARRTDRERKSAGLALVRTKVPTVFAAHALERLLPDPYWKEYATFGLGTYARRLGEAGNAAELERIGALLVRLLQSAKDRAARLDALAGISNAGYAGALPAVRPLLDADDPIVRGGAVQALRLMKRDDVDALIAERLRKDKAPEVRVTAVQAAGNRNPSKVLGDALSERMLADDNARVRMQALKLVLRWQQDLPELSPVLAQVAAREPEGAIRRLAMSESTAR